VILPSPGTQHYEVSVTDTSTGAYRTDVQDVALVFTPPAARGVPERRVDLTEGTEPWAWGGTGAYTPVLGDWTLEVVVRRMGEPDESATFDLPVTEPLPPAVVPPADTGIGVPPPAWMAVVGAPGRSRWLARSHRAARPAGGRRGLRASGQQATRPSMRESRG